MKIARFAGRAMRFLAGVLRRPHVPLLNQASGRLDEGCTPFEGANTWSGIGPGSFLGSRTELSRFIKEDYPCDLLI